MPKSTFVIFILDVIRKLASGKFKVQTYHAISDLLVNELRKSRAAYSDFYQKLEVFLQSAVCRHVNTEIVDCTRRLIDCYPEIDAEFPDELVHFLHFL